MKTDRVFINGRIWNPSAEVPYDSDIDSLYVHNGHIRYIGPYKNLPSHDNVETIDLHGKTVIPGFVNAHGHMSLHAEKMFAANLCGMTFIPEEESAEEFTERCCQIIRTYIESHPEKKTYRACGWSTKPYLNGFPDCTILDKICPNKPLVVQSRCHHVFWVNSVALKMSGLFDHYASPDGGIIYTNDDGKPSGILQEFSAMRLICDSLPEFDFSVEEYKSAILDFCKEYNRLGTTSCYDAMPTINARTAYRELEMEGRLTIWFRGGYITYCDDELYDFEAIIADIGNPYRESTFEMQSVKIFADGIGEKCLWDYAGPGNPPHGSTVWKYDKLVDTLSFFITRGIAVHIHSIAEGTTRMVLDAIEAATEYGRIPHHIVMTHLCRIHNNDVRRMADLGIMAVLQPYWMVGNRLVDSDPPSDAISSDLTYKFNSLISAGIICCGSDDYPIDANPINPLEGIQCAMTRHLTRGQLRKYKIKVADYDSLVPFCSPKECISVENALKCYTLNGAIANCTDRFTGSLEVGKSADFIVIDDIFNADKDKIEGCTIEKVYFRGECVYLRQ